MPTIDTIVTPTRDWARQQTRIAYWIAFAAGLLWTLGLAAQSPGAPLDDEITHYLISRNAWIQPELMLHVWGRPGNTILYMPASLAGLEGRRWFALALSAGTVLLTTAVARRVGVRWLWMIPLCLWFQPWFNYLGYTSITQVPFSFMMILAAYCWLDRRLGAAALIFGLLALVRHEGVALSAAYALYALLRLDLRGMALAALPLVLYNAVYYATYGVMASGNLLDVQPTLEYGAGSWLHFVPALVVGVGVPILFMSAFALPSLRRLAETRCFSPVSTSSAADMPSPRFGDSPLWIFVPYALYFLLHTVIYRFGLFASGGYWLFVLPVAPAFALLAAFGAQSAADALRRDAPAREALRRFIGAGMAVVIVGVGLLSPPIPLDADYRALRDAAAWLTASGCADCRIESAHSVFWRYFDPNWRRATGWLWSNPRPPLPNGALLVWETRYADGMGLARAALTGADWELRAAFEGGRAEIYACIAPECSLPPLR